MLAQFCVRTQERPKAWDKGKDCHPQADLGENVEYGPRGGAMIGEIPQRLYKSPVVEGSMASSVK